MAILLILLGGASGLVVSLSAALFFGAGWMTALTIYFVASIVPVALGMAGVYIHMLLSQPPTDATAAEYRHAAR